MEPVIKYHGEISEGEYKGYLAVHGKVHRLEVPINDEYSEFAVCYLKPIQRTFMSALLSVDDKITRWEMMFTELWIAGDERIKKDDELFYSAGISLTNLLSFRMSRLKKNYQQQSPLQSTTGTTLLEK